MSSETLEQALARENKALDASAASQPSRKVYLCVPFKEKKDAMGFGAQFDNGRNRWYVLQEQAVALMDFPMFKKWLPENALPSAISKPIEPGVATRSEVAADPHPPAAKRSLKPKDGPFKEVWEKMEKNAKALSAAELRVFFLKEIKYVQKGYLSDRPGMNMYVFQRECTQTGFIFYRGRRSSSALEGYHMHLRAAQHP